MHQVRLDQLFDARVAQAPDVHCVDAREVDERLEQPTGAGHIRAVERHLVLVAPHGRAARGADGRRLERRKRMCGAALLGHRADDLRNHLARPLHLHAITDAQVLGHDQVEVVQRRHAHRGTADLHRVQLCEWIERPGTPHVHTDAQQRGFGNVRRELPRDCPARHATAHLAQFLLQRQRVHLDHRAIDGEVDLRAKLRLHARRPRTHRRECGADQSLGCHRNAPRLQRVQQLLLGGERQCRNAIGMHGGIAEEAQRTSRRDCRIQLTQRASGGVARVREHRLTGLRALLVHLLEAAERQVRLTADFQQRRRCVGFQSQRHVVHGAQVRRHVLAHRAAPACGTGHQHPVTIGERDGGTVDLQFAAIPEPVHHVSCQATQPLVPRQQLGLVEGVVQREHRNEMHMLRQCRLRLQADAPRGRVLGLQLGMRTLDVLQFAKPQIVLTVAERRPVQHEILVARFRELEAELAGARCELHDR